MMRDYYDMLMARADHDAVGKMKQFATYFTHGVRHGAQLRSSIYTAHDSAAILELVDAFLRGSPRAGSRSMKKVQAHHRWRLPRQSRTRRLGRRPALQRYEEGNMGSEKHTTNNRMELTAAIEGLKALKEPCEVEVVTDSEYVKNGITTWIHGWKKKGWMTAAKKPVVNQDLWQALDEQVNRHKTTWTWTKGHANHADNNRCDELATRAAREQSSSR